MATVPYTQWLTSVMPEVSGCPRPMVIEAIRSSAIQFCAESRILRVELDGFYTVATQSEYQLDAPTWAVVSDVLSIKVGNRVLEPISQEDAEKIYEDWRLSSGFPQCFFMKNNKTSIIIPIPDDKYIVRSLVALKPNQASQEIDDLIFEDYRDAIKHGAIYYLTQMIDKPWYNPQKSISSYSVFQGYIAKAKSRASKGFNLRKASRVKPYFF